MSPICTVCARAEARYTCPRCQTAYCNLQCYQAHSGKCTESFYQSQVEEELRSQRASEEERRKLEKVVASLARLDAPEEEDEDEGDEPDSDLSLERLEVLAALAEKGELCLEDLSEEEARCFQTELKRGDLGRALGAWEPWWQKSAVLDLSSLDDDDALIEGDSEIHHSPPAHLCCSSDGSRQVHPSVALTVLEALYAYAHTMRVFNGDWTWDALQVAAHLLHLGSGISAHKVYSSPAEALRAPLEAAARLPGGSFGATFDLLCFRDVAAILQRGIGSCARALREAGDVLARAADLARESAKEVHDRKAVSRLQRSAKKLEFLTSFAWHHEEALGAAAAEEVLSLQEVLDVASHEGQEAKNRVEWSKGGVALPARHS
eukprot:TRINITY_DN75754_c0_g1_i1.p1 TRINITY_DN75754_c0_g1~~TRINITY_DN75754_c0_g1_i1.p1  ORF type:complete len:389 (-),score=93.80 TRINITY_DN75754_c0_g1_i1:52-1182(-)